MTLTLYQLALIGGGFTIAGVLIGALAYNYFAVRRKKADSFAVAAREFTTTFLDELNLLESSSKDAYIHILRPAFPKHKAAVYIFRQAISDPIERAAFDKAWKEYYKNEHQPDSPLRQYSTELPQPADFQRNKRRPLAIARIKALLAFAENK